MEKIYPSYRYHPTAGSVVVASAADERVSAPASAGWVETPADLPPPAPADATRCALCGQKLAPAKDAKK